MMVAAIGNEFSAEAACFHSCIYYRTLEKYYTAVCGYSSCD